MWDFIKRVWDSIPDGAKRVVINILMVGAYSFVFVFLQTLTTDWQLSLALTAGVRAALVAIVQVLEAPKPVMTTKAKRGSAVALAPRRKLSEYL